MENGLNFVSNTVSPLLRDAERDPPRLTKGREVGHDAMKGENKPHRLMLALSKREAEAFEYKAEAALARIAGEIRLADAEVVVKII